MYLTPLIAKEFCINVLFFNFFYAWISIFLEADETAASSVCLAPLFKYSYFYRCECSCCCFYDECSWCGQLLTTMVRWNQMSPNKSICFKYDQTFQSSLEPMFPHFFNKWSCRLATAQTKGLSVVIFNSKKWKGCHVLPVCLSQNNTNLFASQKQN